jgi:hypothetical protein
MKDNPRPGSGGCYALDEATNQVVDAPAATPDSAAETTVKADAADAAEPTIASTPEPARRRRPQEP